MWTVYKHTSPSGKVYIGITSQIVKNRWGCEGRGYKSSPYFEAAIKKYGWDKIEHKVLFSGLTKLDAIMIEQDLIYYYKKLGISYNITDGGEGSIGFHPSEETRKKLSLAHKGRKQTAKWIENAAKSKWKPVLQIDSKGNVIKEWNSVNEAANSVCGNHSLISKCCNGKGNSAYGYHWKFK